MISAKEARQTVEYNTLVARKEQLRLVEAKVLSAVGRGEMCCIYCGELSSNTIVELQNLGYTVESHTSPKDGACFEVRW